MASTVLTTTHHSGTVAHARRVGEGAAIFAGALRLVEGREVIGEAGDGLLEDRVLDPSPRPTVVGGSEAVEVDFPC